MVFPNCWRAWSHTEPLSATGRATLKVSTVSRLRDSPPEPDQSRRPQERSDRWPTVGGEEDAAGQLLGFCELKRQRRRRSSDQGDSFTEQDGVDLDLDHVNHAIQLSREFATAAEPDDLAWLPLEIRNETTPDAIDPPDRGRGRQGVMADHVLSHVRIGAVGKTHVQRGLICPAPHDHGIEPASFPGHSESFSTSRPWLNYKVIQNYVFTAKKRPSRTTRNPTLAVHILADSAGRYPNEDREPMLSDAHRTQELLCENVSWMNGSHFVVHSGPPNGSPRSQLRSGPPGFTRNTAQTRRVTKRPRSTGGGSTNDRIISTIQALQGLQVKGVWEVNVTLIADWHRSLDQTSY